MQFVDETFAQLLTWTMLFFGAAAMRTSEGNPMVEEVNLISKTALEQGVLLTFFVVVIAIIVYYLVKVLPNDRRQQQANNQMLFEQVALSRQALDTSNEVIRQNTQAMERTGETHERMVDTLIRHDDRAAQMGTTLALIYQEICK